MSAHLDHLETRYSFRSRVLDYLWAGLPMVLTGGDILAGQVEAAGLGAVVAAGDVRGLEDALARMLADPPPKQRFAALTRQYTWERVAEPLVEFCLAPHRAPDLMVGRASPEIAAGEG